MIPLGFVPSSENDHRFHIFLSYLKNCKPTFLKDIHSS